ncbi:MAG TPA: chemotaxis protein CheA [Terriglobales bacterium]|nr:chemotaxis protein CheA [Terriglobales bacterium]
MSFFSEDRSSELKELFFETSAELLQALNEQGLKLEQQPTDSETVREVRRTVHTLKGDAAACGFQELSGLAHELEDVLTVEISAASNGKLAEIVLSANDVFTSMLSAYREGHSIPSPAALRDSIRLIVSRPEPRHIVPYKLTGHFAWNEYEQMAIKQAKEEGQQVFQIALAVDPACPMKTAAMQLVRNVLAQLGQVLAVFPDPSTASDQLDVIEFAVASAQPADIFQKKCYIPSVILDVLVEAVVETSAQTNQRSAQPTPGDELNDVLDLGGDEHASSTESVATEKEVLGSSSSASNKLRVDSERIDSVLNLVGELVIGKSMLMQSVGEFDKRYAKDPLRAKFADAMAFQARVLNDLQKSVMRIRMVPVDQLFRRFPRIVRDVAKSCGKEVVLETAGEETDLDKSILDVLAEPLSHLVRNSVDHGIETPEERIAAGKARQGTIRLNAYHQGNQIVIECRDDGRGIDRYKLVSRAVEKGIVSFEDAERLSDSEALHLVFHPGLSTADRVTEISGRGVGMDVVRAVVDRLKGSTFIESKPGVGTTFFLKIPLTLAIIKALMFRAGGRLYALPLSSVVEIARTTESEVHRVEQHEVMQLRNEVLTIIRMEQLAIRGPLTRRKKIFIVVVSIAERKFGLIVDRLVGEEELVIKALDDHLVATEFVSGASILGDGSVVLILNLSAVVAKLGKAPAFEEAVTA